MSRTRRVAIGLALIAGVAGSAGAQQPVDELVLRADPGRDDWDVERFERRAHAALDTLASLLVEGALGAGERERWRGVVAPDGSSAALVPSDPQRFRRAGGTFVAVGDRADPAPRPIRRAWRGALRAAGIRAPERVAFKVVRAEPSPAGGWSAGLRAELTGTARGGPAQLVLELDSEWIVGDAAVRLRRLALARSTLVVTPRRWFADRTADALRLDADGALHLRLGGEAWYGRTDAVGEPNLMGHHGIAIGDADGDGREDLYVAMGTGLPNKLLLRQADGTLIDGALAAGVAWYDDTKGVLFADTDGDGDQDLLSAIGPSIVLAKNDGSGRFDRFVDLRASTPAPVYSLSVADYDLDGDLDVYATRYVAVRYALSVPIPFHDARNGPTNHLLRNDGEDRFTDVTAAVGLGANNDRFSLAGVWADYDADGDPDLYVANDFGRNNLYRNDGGRFVDVAAEAGVEDQAAGMGVDWADHDLDGDLDLYVTNMFSAAGRRVAYQPRFRDAVGAAAWDGVAGHALGNSLFENVGDGRFEQVADAAGVRMGRWGWGARFADLDNDGYEDLVVPNGFLSGALEDDL